MRSARWTKLALLGGLAAAATFVTVAYLLAFHQLSRAREARRDDDYGLAEICLASCWRLPGLLSSIRREELLSAVQQGDLRDESDLQSKAGNPSAHDKQIVEALAKGSLATFQWEAAQNYAESILARQPDDAPALWLRGRARVAMQLEEQARQDFVRALEIEPERYEIRRSLADLLHQMGHVRLAIEHYAVLCARRPDDERVNVALAHCLQEDARLTQARAVIDDLLARQPQSVAAIVECGRLALRAGEPGTAERWLRQAVASHPDHADANLALRLALETQQKLDADLDQRKVEKDRRQAILTSRLQESKNEPELLTEVGQWMLQTGHEREAVGWFYAALKEDSQYRPAHQGLSKYFSQSKQPLRATWHAGLGGSQLERNGHNKDSQQLAKRGSGGLASQKPLVAVPAREPEPEEVYRLCAACHAYPPPEIMPRSAWRKEVKQAYDFLRDSVLGGEFPSLESVVLYYERRAPENLPSIEQPTATSHPLKFEKRGAGWPPHLPPQPGIANANLAALFGTAKQELLLCDTRLNALLILKPYDVGPGGTILPELAAPCHTTVCDLDGDGRRDLLVASLGSFFPTDDKLGKVSWLRANDGGRFEAKTILDGVGRVADVQAADFNGDGKLDLVVAAFGWRQSGEIVYLENHTTDWSQPQFMKRVVDERHGAIHVPVADLNGDGRPDFVALISQQHETVVAYLNEGDGDFRQEAVFAARHPGYGMSGIEVVDLDGDRDLDVLLTNGDILDRPHLLKPYHGVQWLENESRYPFKHHNLAAMYGAARAVAADFDGDGDQDIAAVSFLPAPLFPTRQELRLPSVVLLEQQPAKTFAVHVLETGSCDHFSCAAGDWDDDGRIDLVVANFTWDKSQPMHDAAILWRNAGKR